MKKSIFGFLAALGLVFALPTVIAANSLEIKGGVGSVHAAKDKIGFDAGVAYGINMDRYFAVVPEVNFNWIKFENCVANCGGSGGPLVTQSMASYNYYTLPLLINGRFLIPMGSDDTPTVQPYVTVGIGYAWTFAQVDVPGVAQVNDSMAGFMYQGMLGAAFNLGMLTEGSGSATNLIIEAGYRGGQVEKNTTTKADMSGYVIRVGASFNL